MKTLSIIILLSLIAFSCQKEISSENNVVAGLPTITTSAATSITNTTAASGGNITNDGGTPITARGVCWGTSPNPIVTGNHTTDGTGAGAFASNITGLTATTVYYVRAYATNNVGTAYGNEISFTSTNTSTALPTVTTTAASAITMTTAASGGNITSDGGAAVTARGVCWSITANPTIALSTKTIDGTGTGNFSSAITGLTATTTYHIRAYATNSVGTAYGGDSIFTTASTSTIPTITTTAVNAITNTTATSGGTISTDGGAAVTVRGVCWSTTANPTIALPTKTSDGTGIGTFASAITGLTASTLYHVRAYATNSVGTAYGADVSFITTSTSGPDIYVAGVESNGTIDVAKVWKNGVATTLTDGTVNSAALEVQVSGTDVYVAGYSRVNFNTSTPKLWKNGTLNTLMNNCNFGEAYSVFVNGTDVYAAGVTGDNNNCPATPTVACKWKNNSLDLISNVAIDAIASDIFVSGTDVYVAGQDDGFAAFWKNSVVTRLSAINSSTSSIVVSGTDVYITYDEYIGGIDHARLWKNGVVTNLGGGINESVAFNIFVSGTDVYVAGWESNGTKGVAKLWKNGLATSLTDGTKDAFASGVFVFGSDVYVSGGESNGTNQVAKVWKNGVPVSLTNGANMAFGYSVFVK
ncbi:MAG: hypothetical protein ABIN74_03605 [Ferruginibacter sp.]